VAGAVSLPDAAVEGIGVGEAVDGCRRRRFLPAAFHVLNDIFPGKIAAVAEPNISIRLVSEVKMLYATSN